MVASFFAYCENPKYLINAPINCRISIDGSNEEFSIAYKVHIDHWDIDIKRVRKATNAKAINSASMVYKIVSKPTLRFLKHNVSL